MRDGRRGMEDEGWKDMDKGGGKVLWLFLGKGEREREGGDCLKLR